MGFWKNSKRTNKDGKSVQPGQKAATERLIDPGRPEGRGSLEVRKHPVAPGWLWGVLVGLIFLGIGTVQGQLAVVWRKAVMICLECIGIG